MPWNTDSPLGNISVRANRPTMNQNTKYIEFTMGNQAVGSQPPVVPRVNDHFWNIGANEDGRHRFMQSPAFTVGGLAANPELGAGMDSVLYSKLIAGFDVQPFFRNVNANIMQILGIRACGVFTIPNPPVINGPTTLAYNHNLTDVQYIGIGRYLIHFAVNLPSVNYLILGGAISTAPGLGASPLFLNVRSAATLAGTKTVAACTLMCIDEDATFEDPLQAWFVCFGG